MKNARQHQRQTIMPSPSDELPELLCAWPYSDKDISDYGSGLTSRPPSVARLMLRNAVIW
jgi:hypothetical protein